MPYLVFILGILLGLFGLYRFMLNASASQVRALILTAAIATIIVAVFFLAVTGRLPAALGLLVALAPFVAALLKKKRQTETPPPGNVEKPPSGLMSRQEALEILGLEENAGPEEIKAAYKRLIKKAHPDQEGSAWMAAKLNQARDKLIKG